jgi:uncharacterized membrane protein
MSRRQREKRKIRKFSRMLSIIAFIVLVIFLFLLYKLNVLPTKYFSLIAGVLCFMEVIYLLTCLNKRIKVDEQRLTKVERNGSTLVEWGGREV